MANPNIDDATRARAMKFVADKAAPAAKPRVVSKKELDASGMSLRDFLNKERGLTRRKDKEDVDTLMRREARDPEAQAAADRMEETDMGGKAGVESIPLDAPRTPVSGKSASGSELGRNVANTLGAMSGYQGIKLGKAAAEGLTARAAAERAAARRAELAGELRRGEQPTKFTSASSPTASKNTRKFADDEAGIEFRKGGKIQKYASGGAVSASRRGDGIAQKGKTRGRMC